MARHEDWRAWGHVRGGYAAAPTGQWEIGLVCGARTTSQAGTVGEKPGNIG